MKLDLNEISAHITATASPGYLSLLMGEIAKRLAAYGKAPESLLARVPRINLPPDLPGVEAIGHATIEFVKSCTNPEYLVDLFNHAGEAISALGVFHKAEIVAEPLTGQMVTQEGPLEPFGDEKGPVMPLVAPESLHAVVEPLEMALLLEPIHPNMPDYSSMPSDLRARLEMAWKDRNGV